MRLATNILVCHRILMISLCVTWDKKKIESRCFTLRGIYNFPFCFSQWNSQPSWISGPHQVPPLHISNSWKNTFLHHEHPFSISSTKKQIFLQNWREIFFSTFSVSGPILQISLGHKKKYHPTSYKANNSINVSLLLAYLLFIFE